jgi:hypothetical protein
LESTQTNIKAKVAQTVKHPLSEGYRTETGNSPLKIGQIAFKYSMDLFFTEHPVVFWLELEVFPKRSRVAYRGFVLVRQACLLVVHQMAYADGPKPHHVAVGLVSHTLVVFKSR